MKYKPTIIAICHALAACAPAAFAAIAIDSSVNDQAVAGSGYDGGVGHLFTVTTDITVNSLIADGWPGGAGGAAGGADDGVTIQLWNWDTDSVLATGVVNTDPTTSSDLAYAHSAYTGVRHEVPITPVVLTPGTQYMVSIHTFSGGFQYINNCTTQTIAAEINFVGERWSGTAGSRPTNADGSTPKYGGPSFNYTTPLFGLFWDGNVPDINGDANGGSGTWDNSTLNWDDLATGGNDVAWDDTDAIFGDDFPGLVTLGEPISANSVLFDLAGYVLTGSTLTIDGASPAITANQDATISSDLAAPAGLTRGGGGTLTLNGSGAGFSGIFENAAGATTFGSADWAGTDFDLTGGSLAFAGVGTTTVNSLELGANLDISSGDILDLETGMLQFKNGTAATVQGAGTLTASSGTLTVNGGTSDTGNLATAGHAIRTIITDNGGPVALVKHNDNLLILDKANTYSGGTTISGGRVQLEGLGNLGVGDVAVADGGQLYLGRSIANNVTIAGLGTSEGAGLLGAIRFQNTTLTGNVTVDPAGSRVVGYAGASGTIDGALDGTGDLEINIFGNLTANGTISLLGSGGSHTGLVTVSGGRFNMGSALGGSVMVEDAGTLGDEGAISGDLTLGFAGGATLAVDAGTPGAISATNVTLNGVSNLAFAGPIPGGVAIPLLTYSGILTNNSGGALADAFNLSGGFRNATVAKNANTVELSITTETNTWTNGAASGFWEVGGPDANWTNPSDSLFFNRDAAVFDDTAPGTVEINDLDGDIPQPASVTFTNTVGNDYTITGAAIGGNGALTVAGTGTVILVGENTYTGGTVVNDGVLDIFETTGAGNGVGGVRGEVTVNSPGTLLLSTANALGWSSVATKVNTLNINGGSVHTTVLGDNGWDLTINMTGGELGNDGTGTGYYSMGGYAGSGPSINTLASADTAVISANLRIRENNPNDRLPFNVTDGAAATDLLVSGSITNQGGSTRGITKSGDGVMLLSGTNSYPGITEVQAGCLLLNDIFTIPADLTMVTVADGAGFGGIVGASNLLDADLAGIIANVAWDAGGNARLVIDTNGANVTVAADIVGNFKLLKKGAGDLTLTGTVSVNDTIIDEGNVILNPSPDAITIDSITTGPGTNSGKMVTIAFTASGDVDVYASDDLQAWGAAIAEDVAASPFVEDNMPDAKRFYMFVPAGDPAP